MSFPATKNGDLDDLDTIHVSAEVTDINRPRGKHGEDSPLSLSEREGLIVKFRLKARKLSRSILRKWHARLDLEEVDSLVDLSLCEAVRRYDPAKGASFMTFLYFHLRGNLIRAVSEAVTGNGVVNEEDEDSIRTQAAAGANSGRGAPRVVYASEVKEVFYDGHAEGPDVFLLRKELGEISDDAFSRLDPLEKEIIDRIYLKEQQLLDIAESLGYSRCHISRVKKRALEILYAELVKRIGYEMGVPDLERRYEPGTILPDSLKTPKVAGARGIKSVKRRRPRQKKTLVEAVA
jgi:RNA polymerase sigma factor (sigma-70 family)